MGSADRFSRTLNHFTIFRPRAKIFSRSTLDVSQIAATTPRRSDPIKVRSCGSIAVTSSLVFITCLGVCPPQSISILAARNWRPPNRRLNLPGGPRVIRISDGQTGNVISQNSGGGFTKPVSSGGDNTNRLGVNPQQGRPQSAKTKARRTKKWETLPQNHPVNCLVQIHTNGC